MSSKVIDIDTGYKRIVNTLLKELDGVTVKVGVQGTDTAARRGKGGRIENTNQPLAVIAAVHEFGLNKMPKRSFLRSAYDENKPKIDAMVDRIATGFIQSKGLSTRDALNQLGNEVQGMVQKKIVDGPFVPNSPATLKRKERYRSQGNGQSQRPLIDTGRLHSSIRYVIEKGGSKDD